MTLFDISTYFAMASAPLFLLGVIKLRQADPSRGLNLLLVGFLLITATALVDCAKFFEIYTTSYYPYMEDNPYSPFRDAIIPWERWLYWGRMMFRWLGFSLICIGFISEGKRMLSKMKHEAETLKSV